MAIDLSAIRDFLRARDDIALACSVASKPSSTNIDYRVVQELLTARESVETALAAYVSGAHRSTVLTMDAVANAAALSLLAWAARDAAGTFWIPLAAALLFAAVARVPAGALYVTWRIRSGDRAVAACPRAIAVGDDTEPQEAIKAARSSAEKLLRRAHTDRKLRWSLAGHSRSGWPSSGALLLECAHRLNLARVLTGAPDEVPRRQIIVVWGEHHGNVDAATLADTVDRLTPVQHDLANCGLALDVASARLQAAVDLLGYTAEALGRAPRSWKPARTARANMVVGVGAAVAIATFILLLPLAPAVVTGAGTVAAAAAVLAIGARFGLHAAPGAVPALVGAVVPPMKGSEAVAAWSERITSCIRAVKQAVPSEGQVRDVAGSEPVWMTTVRQNTATVIERLEATIAELHRQVPNGTAGSNGPR